MNDTRMIYIEGQPFEGIGELKLEPVEPANPPQVVKVASPEEAVLHANIFPSELVQILTKSTKEAIAAFKRLAAAASYWSTLYKASRAPDKMRWYHMARYAKKARTRKKYRDRLMRAWESMTP